MTNDKFKIESDSLKSVKEVTLIDNEEADEETEDSDSFNYNQEGLSGIVLRKENHHLTLSKKAVLGTFEASMKKATKKYFHTFCEGMLGGIFIGIAYIAAIYATVGIDSAGLKLLIMGGVFTIAILLITYVGGCLYTSNCLGFLNLYLKNVKAKPFFGNLFIAYGGNFVGTFIAILIFVVMGLIIPMYNKDSIDHNVFNQAASSVYMKKIWTIGYTLQGNMITTDQFNQLVNAGVDATKLNEVMNAKVDAGMFFYTFFANLASGIVCNILIASTLYITYSTKNTAAVAIVLTFDILAFVAGGYQHSVANAFLFWIDVFHSGANGYATYDLINVDSHLFASVSSELRMVAINPLSTGYFIGANLIPAFIGNFIGGGLLLPFLLYGVFKSDIKKLSVELLAKKAKDKAKHIAANAKASLK